MFGDASHVVSLKNIQFDSSVRGARPRFIYFEVDSRASRILWDRARVVAANYRRISAAAENKVEQKKKLPAKQINLGALCVCSMWSNRTFS